jgi:hypothetical protein
MQALLRRYDFLFRSTKGLVLVAIAMIALTSAILGTISGPMAELGIRDVSVRVLGLELDPAEREGRIIMLYHTIAMAVVAIETYIITRIVPMKPRQQSTINAVVTVGYMTAMIFGLWFAYGGRNWVFHGLFIAGQSLMFFAGLMLAAALWPWRKKYHIQDRQYAHLGKINLERLAFFVMSIATLGSALFGAVAGANFGNGFESFLAEDVIREPVKSALQLAIIGHLHIMVTLIAVALALIVGRWFDFKGRLHKFSMPLMIVGTIVITLGVWAVVPFEPIAHKIIYGGSVFVLLAALLLVIFGIDKLIRDRIAELGIPKAGFLTKVRAMLHDPLKFGALWQMIFMNFNVSFIGIFVAVRLDEIFRVWPAREERAILTGHWHILSGIIATIILFYYADMAGLKGRLRKWFGWIVIIFSDLAFGAVTVFELKRLFVSEANQDLVVDVTMILGDIGLATVLLALASLLVWRLADLFKRDGQWRAEFEETAMPELDAEVGR